METIRIKGGNHNFIVYERETAQDTAFHKDTPMEVRKILENARTTHLWDDYYHRPRLRLFFGDTKTGRDWHEEHEVVGTIGRSVGRIKIPLLIQTSRSHGGGAILDHCIVKIMQGHRVLYQHPKYNHGCFTIGPSDMEGYYHNVYIDGSLHARFKRPGQAERWIDFMTGKRMSR